MTAGDGSASQTDLAGNQSAGGLTPDLLFVYGTLKRGLAAGHVLDRLADHYRNGTVRGRLYRLDGYPGAIAADDPNDLIHGEVFRLRQPAAALASLDAYEETASGLYRRERWPVTLADAARHSANTEAVVEAWIYVYNRSIEGRPRIRSGRFERG